MMRAKCQSCAWVFDVVATPGPLTDVAHTMQRRAACPLCYHGTSHVAPSRPLTDDEVAAKGLGPLGSAAVTTSAHEATA